MGRLLTGPPKLMTLESEPNIPKSQDSAANPSNDLQNRGALCNASPHIGGDPPLRKKSAYHCSIHTPWWKTLAEMVGITAVVLYTWYTYKAMKVENRPWIAIRTWDGHINPDEPFWVHIQFQNVGKSPALDLKVQVNYAIEPWDYELQLNDIKYRKEKKDLREINTWYPNTMNALPGAWIPKFYFAEPISKTDWQEMMVNKKRFYIFEKATYTDVWGKSIETHFCNYYMSIADPEAFPPTPCDIYNDTPKE
jgi:hypothetical protein